MSKLLTTQQASIVYTLRDIAQAVEEGEIDVQGFVLGLLMKDGRLQPIANATSPQQAFLAASALHQQICEAVKDDFVGVDEKMVLLLNAAAKKAIQDTAQ